MPYKAKIKTLEESYRLVEGQIESLKQSENPDSEKLKQLLEAKAKYLNSLSTLRRAQYENDYETVRMDDDR